MKYLRFGKITEGFTIIPSITIYWMTLDRRYYDVKFAWLKWFFTIGTVSAKLNKMDTK